MEMGFPVSGSAACQRRVGLDGASARARHDPAQRSEIVISRFRASSFGLQEIHSPAFLLQPGALSLESFVRAVLVFCAVASSIAIGHAQVMAPPPAELTPLVGSDGVHAGQDAHLVVVVKLPPRFHTNSNKPRES